MTSAGDLDISSGNLVLVTDTPTVTAIKLNCLLKMFQGGWFADTRLGVPYFRYVFIRNPDLGIVRQILVSVIKSAPGVTDILAGDIKYIANQRTASAVFQVKAGNAVLQGGPGVPFVVTNIGAPSA